MPEPLLASRRTESLSSVNGVWPFATRLKNGAFPQSPDPLEKGPGISDDAPTEHPLARLAVFAGHAARKNPYVGKSTLMCRSLPLLDLCGSAGEVQWRRRETAELA